MSGRRPWGWHRLDPDWAEGIVASAAIRPGELVVDLGAGVGALTLPLLGAGARVIAVELHAGRVSCGASSTETVATSDGSTPDAAYSSLETPFYRPHQSTQPSSN